VLRAKSARYSVQAPLLLGATAGAATAEQAEAIGWYGLAIGEAFQLRDDLLGVFGDPAATGKPVGGDLVEGKRTVLLAQTRAALDEAARRAFDAELDLPPTPARVAALTATIAASGAPDAVERMIAERHQRALDALDGAPLATTAELEALAHRALARIG
jgi:geranylgeranyl diphosphate synthase type I